MEQIVIVGGDRAQPRPAVDHRPAGRDARHRAPGVAFAAGPWHNPLLRARADAFRVEPGADPA